MHESSWVAPAAAPQGAPQPGEGPLLLLLVVVVVVVVLQAASAPRPACTCTSSLCSAPSGWGVMLGVWLQGPQVAGRPPLRWQQQPSWQERPSHHSSWCSARCGSATRPCLQCLQQLGLLHSWVVAVLLQAGLGLELLLGMVQARCRLMLPALLPAALTAHCTGL